MFNPKARNGVLLNLCENHLQLARIADIGDRPWQLDAFREIASVDDPGIEQWLTEMLPDRRGKTHALGVCGFHPYGRVLVRDSLVPRRLPESEYLRGLVAQHAGITSASEWSVAALNPVDGSSLPTESAPRPGLLFGVSWSAQRETQQRLLRLGIRPHRLEVDTLALLGGLMRLLGQMSYPHAAVVCEIEHAQTRVFILGKDGVHTPQSFPHGFLSLAESTMKLLSLPDTDAARRELAAPSEELRAHSRRLVRMISRHLRPAVDYYELQTGQRVGALYCAQLSSQFTWLAEALAAAVDLEPIKADLNAWLPAVGLQIAPDTPPLDASWIPLFSLAADFSPLPNEPKS
jgi:hypothetical protein